MSSNIERIRLLEIELNNLQFKQTTFKREIEKLRTDIQSLKQELTEEEQLKSKSIEEIIPSQVTEVIPEKTTETIPAEEIKETVREEVKKETI